jgi:phosphoribosylanthranilate isomerase
MTVVKICGVRRIEDAIAAAEAGADMIGVNFWPGTKRSLPVEDAATMIAALRVEKPSAPPICGLFVNTDAATIHTTVERCGLDLVQLAGDETPDDLARLSVPVIKTLRPLPDEDVATFAARLHAFGEAAGHLPRGPFGQAFLPLIDANVPGHYGGTGHRVGGAFLAALRQQSKDIRYLLAGGLNPKNVGQAVGEMRPWGVDVASGVEFPGQPGVKDTQRMQAFVRAVRAAEVDHASA